MHIFREPESWEVSTGTWSSPGPEHAWYKWLNGSWNSESLFHEENFPISGMIKWKRSKFAPGKSLRFFELFLELSHFEFRSTVFFTLGYGVDSWIPHLQFFQTVKGKAPKEAWGGHLSGEGINVTFMHPHEPQLSAMRCVALNQIDLTYVICVRSLWYSVHITPPCPRLFLSVVTRFLEKGKFSNRLLGVVVSESCLRCSKILRIRRKFEV